MDYLLPFCWLKCLLPIFSLKTMVLFLLKTIDTYAKSLVALILLNQWKVSWCQCCDNWHKNKSATSIVGGNTILYLQYGGNVNNTVIKNVKLPSWPMCCYIALAPITLPTLGTLRLGRLRKRRQSWLTVNQNPKQTWL